MACQRPLIGRNATEHQFLFLIRSAHLITRRLERMDAPNCCKDGNRASFSGNRQDSRLPEYVRESRHSEPGQESRFAGRAATRFLAARRSSERDEAKAFQRSVRKKSSAGSGNKRLSGEGDGRPPAQNAPLAKRGLRLFNAGKTLPGIACSRGSKSTHPLLSPAGPQGFGAGCDGAAATLACDPALCGSGSNGITIQATM